MSDVGLRHVSNISHSKNTTQDLRGIFTANNSMSGETEREDNSSRDNLYDNPAYATITLCYVCLKAVVPLK